MDIGDRSILADMALQFVPQREIVATAGLGHLLRRSATAREHLRTLVSTGGVSPPDTLQYRNEQWDETAPGRPDIVGSIGGEAHLILEGKFWAALTPYQPCRYLDRLTPDGCLLFVAPAKRQDLLWRELHDRCRQEGLRPRGEIRFAESIVCIVGESRRLAITSWTALLAGVGAELDRRGETEIRSDLDQLLSLCRLEDEEAFLPLTPLDLATPRPLRVMQLMGLVDKIYERGLAEGGPFQPGMMPFKRLGVYGRYIRAGHFQLALSVDLQRWHNHGSIPLWLEVAAAETKHALSDFRDERPPRVVYNGYDHRPVVGLPLALHVEELEIIKNVLSQIIDILERVKNCRPTVELTGPPNSSLTGDAATDDTAGGDTTSAGGA
jgi:hypothetical protein